MLDGLKTTRTEKVKNTYHIVLDAVDAGVDLFIAVEMVFNAVDSQDTQLLEGPSRQGGHELPVASVLRLLLRSSNLGLEPLVLEHLGRAQDGEARRVESLHDGDEGQLLSGSKEVLGVNDLGLLLGVVAVGRGGGSQDRSQERSGAEAVANGVGEGESSAGDLEVLLEAGSDVRGGVEDENIVGLGGGDGVVVEVVDDGASSLRGERDVELSE